MNRLRSIRSLVVASAVALLAVGMVVSATPAAAGVAPTVDGPAPMSGPTAGGTPIRIYGSDFTGATAVKFGTTSATSFKVIDDNLITAVIPSYGGSSNTRVDISVTTSFGTGTMTNGFYYTDATFTVTTTPPVHPGDNIAATVNSYAVSTTVIFPEFNPLQVYLEGVGACSKGATPTCPPAFTGSPAYAQVLGSQKTTNGSGYYSYTSLPLPNPFTGNAGTSYDTNIACPVKQTTADYLGNSAAAGLNKPSFSGKCHVAVGQFGFGTLERPITYFADPTPASPVLTTDKSTASVGNTVTITTGSVHWNANPFFGSSTLHTNPGETAVTVKICGIPPSNCSTTVGSGTVDMTRYETSSITTPISATLSGASLSGSIVVGADARGCTTCFVQVTQSKPSGGSITATTALTVNP